MGLPQLGRPFEPTDYAEESDSDTSHTSIRRFLDPVHDYGEHFPAPEGRPFDASHVF